MTCLKSRTFIVILSTVLLLVVVALLIYGISTHSEVGMMRVTPGWNRSDFPLKVCAHPYVESTAAATDAVEVVGDAIQTTNTRLGFQAYVVASARCPVNVIVGAPSEYGWIDPGGNYVITREHCTVQTVNVHGELRDLVMQHELGHCLGLAHDTYEQSIMWGTQHETPMGQLPPWISDSDRSLLRTSYGPQ